MASVERQLVGHASPRSPIQHQLLFITNRSAAPSPLLAGEKSALD